MILMTKTPLHLVIAEHGAARVFWAALIALLKVRKETGATLDLLSDHIRKDVGLPPRVAPPKRQTMPVRW